MAAFDSTQIARLATGLYAVQIGNTTMQWALDSVNGNAYGSVAALANALYTRDFGGMTNAAVASLVVANVGITTAAQVAEATTIVTNALNAAAAGKKGETILGILNGFATLTTPAYADAVAAFNAQIAIAEDYAKTANTKDVSLASLTPVFNLDNSSLIAGLQSMNLTGNQDVRINFSNTANQITGLDLNGNGTIEADGRENKVTGVASGFEAVDAYPRNPWNHKDTANNFLGDIDFDGRSYQGDGVKTNGNIVLGGLGGDTIYGGVGNDFLAGGGVAQGSSKQDYLSGGRNADFFFAEFSAIGAPSASLEIDGGNTADDVSAGNEQSPQDADWLLLEANDDDEPVQIWLNDDNLADQRDGEDGLDDSKGRVLSRAGDSMVIDDIENIDASGNLYGFLNNIDVLVGKRATDDRDSGATAANVGYGSAAQLWISGSYAANIIIGGYDNDYIEGRGGNDLLMGGNLNFKNDPNLSAIINNGRDELVGGAGSDNLVFETDGGIYEGGDTYDVDDGEPDTLWLTRETFGTQNVSTVTSDGYVRLDLGVGKEGGLANYAGYGGADKAAATGRYTSDQTMYKSGYARTQVQDMESVIATGLGAVDYKAAGANSPNNASAFDNQQNHLGFTGNLDLRGTTGANTLYAAAGTDVIEGREGNDKLSGGDGNDDFYFQLTGVTGGDGVDVIHRQQDTNADNLWDTDATTGAGLFERDFNIGGTSTTGPSKLKVDLGSTNLASADVAMTSFTIKIGGVSFSVTDTAALMAKNTAAEVAELVNSVFHAQDSKVTAVAVGNTIEVVDTGGRDISDTVSEGYAVGGVVSNGAFSALATYVAPGTETTKDRLIYKAYEDRADNEGVDDDSFIGSTISLGTDSYAEDLVISFVDEDGDGLATTRIAEDQAYTIKFTNLTTQDKVTITVNDVKYSLTVGVDLDGNIIAAEDGVNDTQAGIQTAFVNRLASFMDTFMDDDTAAGSVSVVSNGVDTLTITQRDYNGEETVFMRAPTVALTNTSGGEPATYTVTNVSQHELELLDFDGRNAQLNNTNVLFWGEEKVQRAILETAPTLGNTTITGKEAVVIDVGANNLQDTVFGTDTAIPNNTASNSPLSNITNGFAVHGDDFLLGGAGTDLILGGTGDDRVEGSVGSATVPARDFLVGERADGGKNFYAVQVLGEAQARVYILNKWEAANPGNAASPLFGLTLANLPVLIDQSESGQGTISGVFDDTLQFSQQLFDAGKTKFTVVLDEFNLVDSKIELRHDGAGYVGVDKDGNDQIDSYTRFRNFENIRTVSGTGNAVAGDGQGNDTLNVVDMSNVTTGAGGILYKLIKGADAGEVRYSKDTIVPAPAAGQTAGSAVTERPEVNDYEELVIKVDGVENVKSGTGNDLLLIDETEAAKNNSFDAGLGIDRIEYLNHFVDQNNNTSFIAQPTVTIKVNSATDTDTVTMKGGRVGTLNTTSGGAVDTLIGVEYLKLGNETAQSTREDDLIDVTSIATGAVVDYSNGEVRAISSGGIVPGTGVQLVIDNIVQMENVIADGDDTVIVADADKMNDNARSDELNATPATNIQLSTYLDYDTWNLNATTGAIVSRKPFSAQSDVEISDVINQNQFTFNLGTVGTDTVDYSNEAGRIVAVMNFKKDDPNKFVLVDGNSNGNFADTESRVDKLVSVERIVASQGDSIIDLTNSGRATNVIFSYNQPNQKTAFVEGTHKIAALDRQINVVRVSDAVDQSALGNVDLLEYRDLGDSATISQPTAQWNSVEGSDFREYVQVTQWEDEATHVFNLRGGNNEVNYNERTNGIRLTISDLNATVGGVANQYSLTVRHLNDVGGEADTDTDDTIRGYNQANAIGGTSNSLRIEASQGDQDFIDYFGLGAGVSAVVLLGQVESSGDSVVTASFVDSATGAVTGSGLTLSGFEKFWDGVGADTYFITDLTGFAQKITLIDFGQTGVGPQPPSNDRDTIKLDDGAFETATIRPPVGQTITISNNLFMGSASNNANDLQRLGVNDVNAMQPYGTGTSRGFDFQVLDIQEVDTINNITVTGSGAGEGSRDEVILGDFARISTVGQAIQGIDILSLTNKSAGTVFDFDIVAGELQGANGVKILGFDNFMRTLDLSRVTGRDVTITANSPAAVDIYGGAGNDTITGSAGNDRIVGGAGNDTLDGGTAAEVRAIQINPTGSAGAAGTAVTITLDGFALTLNLVAAVVDTDANLGDNLDVLAGVGSHTIGAALETLVNANLTDINNGVRFGGTALAGAKYDNTTGLLKFTFAAGTDVLATDPIVIAGAGLGGITVTGESVVTEGGGGGVDTFQFGATAAANGADTLKGFIAGVGGDVIDLSFSNNPKSEMLFLETIAAYNDEAAAVTVASTLEDVVNNEIVFVNANGTALTAASLAAEFSVAGGTLTAFLASGIDANGAGKGMKSVVVEIDSTKTAEDAKMWFVFDSNNNGTIEASEVALVGTIVAGGDFNYDTTNFN